MTLFEGEQIMQACVKDVEETAKTAWSAESRTCRNRYAFYKILAYQWRIFAD